MNFLSHSCKTHSGSQERDEIEEPESQQDKAERLREKTNGKKKKSSENRLQNPSYHI